MRALATGRAISHDSFQQMIRPTPTPVGDGYGLGDYIWQVRGETMIGHTGQIAGFALGNDDSFDARVAGRRLAAIAVGEPYPEVVAVRPSDE